MRKKILQLGSRVLKILFLTVLCILTFSIFTARISGGEPSILGYRFMTVLSGSMEPVFQTGSIISIKLADSQTSYQKGDIVMFKVEDKLITHRITAVKSSGGHIRFKTKGDHNNTADLWSITPSEIVGKYTGYTIPYLGYVMNIANSRTGAALLMIIPGILLLVSSIYTIYRANKLFEGKKV